MHPPNRISFAALAILMSMTLGATHAQAQSSGSGSYPTQAFFGDTHLHTSMSFDAAAYGATTTPDDAYRFAKGEKVVATGGMDAQLRKPLDFLVVSDHSENLGWFNMMRAGEAFIMAHPQGRDWHERLQAGGETAFKAGREITLAFAGGRIPKELQLDAAQVRPVWETVTEAAETHNDPGKFTAFIGYEWTSMVATRNLHRVVIFKDGADKAKQVVPFSAQDSPDPEMLWEFLQSYEDDVGGQVLAIAHNGNLSNGQMFSRTTYGGERLDSNYVQRRTKWEPLYEVTQIKGDGETHRLLSPDDEFADFETWDIGGIDGSVPKTVDMLPGEYAREALKTGLLLERSGIGNPFKFGMIGSTDSHTSLATADDDNFFGKFAELEPRKERMYDVILDDEGGTIKGYGQTSSGYAAVWAHENTRASIFEAMERRETYATTGPRMNLRFFGGWDFTDKDAKGDFVKAGYTRGVPMGGDLHAATRGAPSFIVAATKDPEGANLDRVQVIKGWVDSTGKAHERVYDVAVSDGRTIGADGRARTPVGNTVDVESATWTNSIGDPQMITVWTDPDFDARERAFYYVRVLEIPTPRWTAYDVKRFGTEVRPAVPMVTQQRAYSSAIWYTP